MITSCIVQGFLTYSRTLVHYPSATSPQNLPSSLQAFAGLKLSLKGQCHWLFRRFLNTLTISQEKEVIPELCKVSSLEFASEIVALNVRREQERGSSQHVFCANSSGCSCCNIGCIYKASSCVLLANTFHILETVSL